MGTEISTILKRFWLHYVDHYHDAQNAKPSYYFTPIILRIIA